MDSLVATTDEAYVDLAVTLTRDAGLRHARREELLARRESCSATPSPSARWSATSSRPRGQRRCKLRAVEVDGTNRMTDAKPLSRIVLGLTGGIAAYKAAELTRLFVKEGVRVDVCMTESARRFIAPLTLQALSGRPVLTDLWASGADNGMGHINLSRGADAIVVAPASADFLAKIAHGHADDLLSTLDAGARMPAVRRAGDESPDVGQRREPAQRRDARR